MTIEEYYEILQQKYEELHIGDHPTLEQLHEYNQFKARLRKEVING